MKNKSVSKQTLRESEKQEQEKFLKDFELYEKQEQEFLDECFSVNGENTSKEMAFAHFLNRQVKEGLKDFGERFVSACVMLKSCKHFQPFNWIELKSQCQKYDIELSLDLKTNALYAKPIK